MRKCRDRCLPSIGSFKVPSYANDIILFDQTLSEKRLSSARSVFSHSFLLRAAKKSVDWGRVMPAWYAFYADHFKSGESRMQRIQALDLVFSNLRDVPGKSNSRRGLEKRILDPGFAGSEAFFEVSVLAAALSLQPESIVELYPELSSGRPEFSVGSGERRIFFEATCFKLMGKGYLPKSGWALTTMQISESRLKSKFENKKGQLPSHSPNVLLVGIMGIDPIEDQDLLARRIIEGARQHFLTDSITSVLVLWFNPLSDLVLMRAERLDSRANELSTKETEVIQRLESRFRRPPKKIE